MLNDVVVKLYCQLSIYSLKPTILPILGSVLLWAVASDVIA